MKTPFRLPGRLWLPVFVLLLAANARAQGGEDVDVQTSGPVHEGFANPTVFEDSSEPFYVEVDPPTLIEEQPPQERPTNTEWVPGYWSYEDESRNWMWVSGTWRATPPGYVWVSGYWIKTWKGWRYVRGYWAPVGYGTDEIVYLPPPPPTIESGPIGHQPWVNAIWVPGTWIWVSGGYLGWMWQPGYWLVYNPDWTWVPASYVWTPYGYIFVPGHYDHSCEHRGLLYAPVFFPRQSYLTLGFAFCPSFVINVSLFSGCFFTRPAYSHYYFGDYYAETCWNRGIYPAFSFQYTKYGYDPIFAHATVQYGKGNPHWAETQRSDYLMRRNDVTKRPAKTLALQNRRQGGPQIAVAAKDAGEKATTLKLERVPDSDKGKLLAQAKEMRNARAERVKVEAADAKNDKIPDAPRKVKSRGFVPGSMVAKAVESESKVVTPKQPDIPKNLEKAEPDLDRRRPTPGRGKLRDPSLDLPVQGGKPADTGPGKKPGDDVGGKKPGDDVGGKKPGDDVGGKKPGDDVGGKKPGDDVGGKKPDDVPGRRPPFTKPEDTGGKKPGDTSGKKPGDDTGGKKPDEVPGRRPPFTKPEDTQPGGKKPGDTSGKKPGDDVGGKKPDPIRPPARKPDEGQPGGKKPEDTQPGGKKPEDTGGRRPPLKKPDDNQPGKKPDDTGKKPEDTGKRPAGGQPTPPPKPGDRRLKPGEVPPPGPESKPVKKPNEKSDKGGG